jgi:fluoride ion exporter CrcB/FEX
MVQHQRILFADPFSYTRPGASWSHPGYPYEVMLYLVYTAAGKIGITLIASLILIAAFLILWKAIPATVRRRSLLVAAAVVVSAAYWSVRPNLFALLFSVITAVLLERYRAGNYRAIWLLPPLTLLWANLHGSFILAFILLAVYALDWLMDRTRLFQIVQVGILMALATLATPYGLGVYQEMIATSARVAERTLIQEWQSPNFHQWYGLVCLLAALITMGLFGLRTQRLAPSRLALPLVLIALSFYSARNIAIFGILLPFAWNPLLPPQNAATEQPQHLQPWLAGLTLGLFLFALVNIPLNLLGGSPSATLLPEVPQPVGSVAYLKQTRPIGNLFNDYATGGYLVWALPEYPVFVDSRSDIYGDEILIQSLTIENAQPDWQKLVAEWHINIVLVSPESALSAALSREADWQACFHEPHFTVFLRADACP